MRRISNLLAWIIFAIPAIQWMVSICDSALLQSQLPPGQWLYLFSKLFAQYAFLLLTVQLGLGLSLATNKCQFGSDHVTLHRNIGLSVLAVVILHAAFFVCGVWLRSGHFPFAVLTPQFNAGYYNTFVSVGVIAACLLIGIAILGLARKQIPMLFNYFHRMSWVIWGLGYWHSIAIGTETNSTVIWSWLYYASAFTVVMLFMLRLYRVFVPNKSVDSQKKE